VCVSALLVTISIPSNQLIIFSLPFLYFIIALLTGSMLSVPLAVYTVKKLPLEKLQPIIGVITIILGVLTLIKAYQLVV